MYAHTVCTRPFFLPLLVKGPGYEGKWSIDKRSSSLRVLVHATGPVPSVDQLKFSLKVVYHLRKIAK